MIAFVLALLALCLTACERPPSAESLKEWTPADHHSNDDDKIAAAQQAPGQRPTRTAPAPSGAPGAAAANDVGPLVDLTWRRQCSSCHGPAGKGDGQMGAMLRVPDLTNDAWQAKVSDAEIGTTIKNGRGKMPSFDVPDPVIRGLVARVRAARGR